MAALTYLSKRLPSIARCSVPSRPFSQLSTACAASRVTQLILEVRVTVCSLAMKEEAFKVKPCKQELPSIEHMLCRTCSVHPH